MSVIDSNVQTAINNLRDKGVDFSDRFNIRAEIGYKKYGVTTEREDLTELEWINHTIEEIMDAMIYLIKLKNITQDVDWWRSDDYDVELERQSVSLVRLINIEKRLKNEKV